MKKLLVLVTLAGVGMFTSGSLTAQPAKQLPPAGGPMANKQERRETIEALKVAYITKTLDLSADEAKLFWPVYNAYQDELHSLNKEQKLSKPPKPLNEMTEAELNSLIDSQIENEQKRVDLKKKYVAEFKKVIPVKKIVLLHQAEKNFVKEVLQQYRDAREE